VTIQIQPFTNWLKFRGADALSGDVTGAADDNTLSSIQGTPVAAPSPQPGDVMLFNGSEWVNDPTLTNLINTVNALQSQVSALSNGQGFNLSLGSSPTPNVLLDGTTLFTVST
jgi:hypothetical protein